MESPLHVCNRKDLRPFFMVLSPMPKYGFFPIALFFIAISPCFAQQDPSQIVAKALPCFNNRLLYASCQEAYRLTESGNINVPPEETDEYCNGPCLDETYMVLNCVNSILNNFIFYNKAGVEAVRSTLNAACGYTSDRGNFNVASHLQDEPDHGHLVVIPTHTFVILWTIVAFLLLH